MIKSIKIGPQKFTIIERSPDEDGMLSDGAYGYTLDSKILLLLHLIWAMENKK